MTPEAHYRAIAYAAEILRRLAEGLVLPHGRALEEAHEGLARLLAQRVRFVAEDVRGLWEAGEEAVYLGPEALHPEAPPIHLFRLVRDGEIIALTSPFSRGLVRISEWADETP
jgi:hypothetical protein